MNADDAIGLDYKQKKPLEQVQDGGGGGDWYDAMDYGDADPEIVDDDEVGGGYDDDGANDDPMDYGDSDAEVDYDDEDGGGYDDEDDDDGEDLLIEKDLNDLYAKTLDRLPPGVELDLSLLENRDEERYKTFKQFDTVDVACADHYFISRKKTQTGGKWAKKIQNDWKLLVHDLPNLICVRIYEDRMDVMRAAIIGAAGTPYHDGIFFFDVHFPAQYPAVPPAVHYHAHGLRLNPNLYACGRVCLSLLNTWPGRSQCELWYPAKSTMLQVLLSIQALILNAEPYFNEPGHNKLAGSYADGTRSVAYNESTLLLSLKTMIYTLRKPPQHFEDFVAGHFRRRGPAVLAACKAYMAGAAVGGDIARLKGIDRGDDELGTPFQTSLKAVYEELLMEFSVKGADCSEFLRRKVRPRCAEEAEAEDGVGG